MTSLRLKHVYNTAAWRRLCARVKARDVVCIRCGSDRDLTCHHTNPGGDPYDESYVVTLCRPCHGVVDGPRASRRPRP